MCRFCEEENETFCHLATICPAFWQSRDTVGLQLNLSSGWSVATLINFALIPSIRSAMSYDPDRPPTQQEDMDITADTPRDGEETPQQINSRPGSPLDEALRFHHTLSDSDTTDQ